NSVVIMWCEKTSILLNSIPIWGQISNYSLSTHNPSVQREIVNKHNELRRMANPTGGNILKMTWNEEAALNAEKWAKNCILSHSHDEQRSISFANCGENLFFSTSIRSWPDVIQVFFDEVKIFKFGYGPIKKAKVLHYTQLVWATSHQLGCAMSHCPNQKMKYLYDENSHIFLKSHFYFHSANPCMYKDEEPNCSQLTKNSGCNNNSIKEKCQASCKCQTEIK
uniref:ShKT domain-containing protein n=1 Tax=Monodelphis domestica TaxID=13616 RepID=F7DWI1_MONDO